MFNDTDDEVLWLIVGAPEELEFLKGSKSKIDLSDNISDGFRNNCPKELPAKNGPRKAVDE